MSYLYGDMGENDDTNSDLSDQGRFLTKGKSRIPIYVPLTKTRQSPGAFLLTPSHDLTLDKAATICDKLNFRGSFSLVKTATGILFKFSEPEDYNQVFRKGFHKVNIYIYIWYIHRQHSMKAHWKFWKTVHLVAGHWRQTLQESGDTLQTAEDVLAVGIRGAYGSA